MAFGQRGFRYGRRKSATGRWAATVETVAQVETALLRNTIVGGDTNIVALYSINKNVGVSAGTAVTWDDLRGTSGFGPQLVGTAHAPSWDATNLLITGSGTSQYMVSAASSLFDTSTALTIVAVAATPVPSALSAIMMLGGGGSFTLGVRAQTTPSYLMLPTNTQLTGANPANAGPQRLLYASKDASATSNIAGAVVNHAANTSTNANYASANRQLSVLALSDGTQAGTSSIRAVLVLNRVATAGDVSALATWAVQFHSAVLV